MSKYKEQVTFNQDIKLPEKKEDQNQNNKCNMCGEYSGNYILCNTCSVIISVG